MKQLNIKLLKDYKSYKKDSVFSICGDLVVISGINGCGKSQLLKIIANNDNVKIDRELQLINNKNCCLIKPNEILLFSFRDNIDIGSDFGHYTVSMQQINLNNAWNFYEQNIRFKENDYYNTHRIKAFNNKEFIYNPDGSKKSTWRSILQLCELLEENFKDDKKFKLNINEFEKLIPIDFIWRNENDIVQQVGNLFYIACCDRVDKQIKCSTSTKIFDNDNWLKTAPWTILNKLFEELGFKYRFKDDYLFNTPNMEENPKLRIGKEVRQINDLSDGEKAILKLALNSLDQEISKDVKLVLYDEYDAPLNPSLIEAFYKVINEFYIKKNIQVIITTHSPATISLAPTNTKFYELFAQENNPKLIEVNQFDYAELKEANKTFYDKLKNQKDRIFELEKLLKQKGNALLVEDEYNQIYKIAYLKLKGVDELTEDNLDEKFLENSNFTIEGSYSSGGLFNFLKCPNTTLDINCKRICLFDFDYEGYSKYEKLMSLKTNNRKLYLEQHGKLCTGLYIKHADCNRYAMMLPIPDRLKDFVSTSTSSDCFIEIETLLDSEYLKNNDKAKQRSPVLKFYKLKDNHKFDFWKDLLNADKSIFNDFQPLFKTIETIFKS